jgi:hypothetical protein
MSTDLAIAGVTATLRHLLRKGIVDHAVLGAQGPVSVTAQAPDLVDIENSDLADQLNLYMYHVAPNPGWRNMGLPSRDAGGSRIANPPLALDLFYIVTAYSQKELYADVLLGYAMQFLHEVPILTQSAIENALDPAPPEVGFIQPEDLLAQFEQIKIAPHVLTADDMYKLWMAFQTTYRPSAAYHVSVVLIENARPALDALPVLTIGRLDAQGRPGGVAVHPGVAPRAPTLTGLTPPAKNGPVLRLDDSFELAGFHLADGPVSVTLTNLLTPQTVALTVTTSTDSAITAQMPPTGGAPAGLRCGPCVIGVTVGVGAGARATNRLTAAVAPKIVNMLASGPVAATVLTLTCAPPVWSDQTISVLVGGAEVFPDSWSGPSTGALTFTFDATSFSPPGPGKETPWVRLRVDGVDSVLIDRSTDPPSFDPTQKAPL